jgi:hypothetical protein
MAGLSAAAAIPGLGYGAAAAKLALKGGAATKAAAHGAELVPTSAAKAAFDTAPSPTGVEKTVDGTASPAARRPDFVANADGTVIPTSRSRLEGGFQDAGFPSAPTKSPGTDYTLPSGTHARVMEPSGPAPTRVSFENANGQPVGAFTDKPVQPPPGLDKAARLDYVRSRTHVELGL